VTEGVEQYERLLAESEQEGCFLRHPKEYPLRKSMWFDGTNKTYYAISVITPAKGAKAETFQYGKDKLIDLQDICSVIISSYDDITTNTDDRYYATFVFAKRHDSWRIISVGDYILESDIGTPMYMW
jgi:hypothetical protein